MRPEPTLWAPGTAPPAVPTPGAPGSELQSVPTLSSQEPRGAWWVVVMDRHYFQNTGAYDPLLSLQGGGNLELSRTSWATGGPGGSLSRGQGSQLEATRMLLQTNTESSSGCPTHVSLPAVLSLDLPQPPLSPLAELSSAVERVCLQSSPPDAEPWRPPRPAPLAPGELTRARWVEANTATVLWPSLIQTT